MIVIILSSERVAIWYKCLAIIGILGRIKLKKLKHISGQPGRSIRRSIRCKEKSVKMSRLSSAFNWLFKLDAKQSRHELHIISLKVQYFFNFFKNNLDEKLL